MLTKALESAAASAAGKSTTYTVQKHPVMMQVGEKELWVSELSEYDMKRFVENVDADDIVFKEYKGTTYLWLQIKPEDAEYKTVYRQVQTCAYDGTEKLLEAMFGIKLHYSDKEWYRNHPAVVASGLPDGATLGVLQALVKPYDFGISEIIMKRGRGKTADTVAWMDVMGINPMSQVNNLVTDDDYMAQFAELDPETFATIEADVKTNRFRYADVVYGPAVIFGSMSNVSYASGGGHARYLAPREKSDGFQYAIRFSRIDKIDYKGDVDALLNDFQGDVEERKELSFWSTKYKGRTMTSLTSWNNSHKSSSNSSNSSAFSGPSTGGYTPPKPKEARLPGEDLISMEDAEAMVPGFKKLCTSSGIAKVYGDDLVLNPDLMNTLYDFCTKQAKDLGSKIKAEWLMLPCGSDKLVQKGDAAKRLRREIRKFRDEVAAIPEGLINFALAAERLTTDCERWILYTVAKEVYL